MKRTFIGMIVTLAVGVLVAPWSHGAQSQTPARIGVLAFDAGGCTGRAVSEGLRELNYIEGNDFVMACRHADGRYDALDTKAAELLQWKPSVIVALGHAPTQAAQRATPSVPIVMLASGEPVAAGLIASFARPGGNITGLSYFNTELNIKRLEFLKAIVPELAQVAVLVDPAAPRDLNHAYIRDAVSAGKTLGFSIHVVEAASVADLDRAFEASLKKKAQALFVPPKLRRPGELERIVELARRYRLPVMHYVKTFPEIGGLISYGTDYGLLQRRAAVFVDKILRGAKAAELPVEQPMRYILVINLTTARELGLNVPQTLLQRADKVID